MPRARGIRLTPWITRRGPANVELPNVSHDCYNLKTSFKGSGGFERCPVRTTQLGSAGTAGATTVTSARERAALHPQGHSLRDCLRQRLKAAQEVARRL